MKEFLKRNFLLIISFSILFIIVCISARDYWEIKNNTEQSFAESLEFCKNTDYIGTQHEQVCLDVLSREGESIDFFTAYLYIGVLGLGQYGGILFLFIIIPSLYYNIKYLKNRIIVNDATRMDYKTIRLRIFKNAYRSFFILPVIVIIAFLISYIINPNLDASYAINHFTTVWRADTLSHPSIFVVSYLLNIIFYSIFFINIGLIIVRKHYHFFVAVFLSFLIVWGIDGIFEIGINGVLFSTILHSEKGSLFNILNYLSFNDTFGILPVLLLSASLAIVSSFIVYLKYKNKEKLITDCERI